MSRNTSQYFVAGVVALAVSGVVSTASTGRVIRFAQTDGGPAGGSAPMHDGGGMPSGGGMHDGGSMPSGGSMPAGDSMPTGGSMPTGPGGPGNFSGGPGGNMMEHVQMFQQGGGSTGGPTGGIGGPHGNSFSGPHNGPTGSYNGGSDGNMMEHMRNMYQQGSGPTGGIGGPIGGSSFEQGSTRDHQGPPSNIFSMPGQRNGMDEGMKMGRPFGGSQGSPFDQGGSMGGRGGPGMHGSGDMGGSMGGSMGSMGGSMGSMGSMGGIGAMGGMFGGGGMQGSAPRLNLPPIDDLASNKTEEVDPKTIAIIESATAEAVRAIEAKLKACAKINVQGNMTSSLIKKVKMCGRNLQKALMNADMIASRLGPYAELGNETIDTAYDNLTTAMENGEAKLGDLASSLPQNRGTSRQ